MYCTLAPLSRLTPREIDIHLRRPGPGARAGISACLVQSAGSKPDPVRRLLITATGVRPKRPLFQIGRVGVRGQAAPIHVLVTPHCSLAGWRRGGSPQCVARCKAIRHQQRV